MSTIYMDNNATTQLAPQVASIMADNLALYGNASSMHELGRNAYSGIDWARKMCASLIDAEEDEIYFTSGASESNNTVFNTMRDIIDSGSVRDRIITTTVEHPSIMEEVKYLKEKGYKIDLAPVDATGMVKVDELEKMLGSDVLLVSVMTGNNETGTIQPVSQISALAHAAGAFMHSDATQAIGKIPVSVRDMDLDYLSMSAHKFYGPQKEHDHLWMLRERLRNGIEKNIPDVVINGNQEHCLPGTLNVSFPCAEGESILLYLDMEGIEVSTGSACATGSLEPSYVLLACGLDVELAHGSIRFSLGRYNTVSDVDTVIEKLPAIIKKVRSMSTRKV